MNTIDVNARRSARSASSIDTERLLELERDYCSHGDTVHYTDPPKIFERCEGSYIYEPDGRAILSELIPTYLEITIYRALLESTASEHGARMTAMRNASDNAGTLIDDLTLKMNRARQAEITQEILEVVAGADALT